MAKRIDSHTTTNFLLENHLWGSTQSRFRYGLFLRSDMQTLVAVATFSARWRKRRENGQVRHSHELIRYCSRRGETVVGGISKLISAFKQDQSPHEIVTVIDRDWGSGEGWSTLGFTPLRRLPPVTFFVGPDGRRCHPGVGPNPYRRRMPDEIISELEQRLCTNAADMTGGNAAEREFLATKGYFPVHDAGAERHLLVCVEEDDEI